MRTKSTKFIKLDTGKCIACWKCVDVCTNQILNKMVVYGIKILYSKNLKFVQFATNVLKYANMMQFVKLPKLKHKSMKRKISLIKGKPIFILDLILISVFALVIYTG